MKKILALLLTLALALSLCACSPLDYKKACKLFDQGEYEKALALFEELGDYEDSAAQALGCRYELAKELFAGSDYEAARRLFEELGNFQDSADWAARCAMQEHVGAYKLTGLTIDGEDMSDYMSMLGYESYVIRFEADGTGSLEAFDYAIPFTWDDSYLMDGYTKIPLAFDGSSVTLETDGVSMIYTRK